MKLSRYWKDSSAAAPLNSYSQRKSKGEAEVVLERNAASLSPGRFSLQ